MSAEIYLLTIGLPLATVLLIFGMRYGAKVAAIRASRAETVAQQEVLDSLAEIKARLAGIEKILKDVE